MNYIGKCILMLGMDNKYKLKNIMKNGNRKGIYKDFFLYDFQNKLNGIGDFRI